MRKPPGKGHGREGGLLRAPEGEETPDRRSLRELEQARGGKEDEGQADHRGGWGARPHPHQSSPSNHSKNLSIYKNWQIYSEGAHFQEAKGEGGRGELSSPLSFFLILISLRG